jgi:hypothetical protein
LQARIRASSRRRPKGTVAAWARRFRDLCRPRCVCEVVGAHLYTRASAGVARTACPTNAATLCRVGCRVRPRRTPPGPCPAGRRDRHPQIVPWILACPAACKPCTLGPWPAVTARWAAEFPDRPHTPLLAPAVAAGASLGAVVRCLHWGIGILQVCAGPAHPRHRCRRPNPCPLLASGGNHYPAFSAPPVLLPGTTRVESYTQSLRGPAPPIQISAKTVCGKHRPPTPAALRSHGACTQHTPAQATHSSLAPAGAASYPAGPVSE